jgi:hypothetical protein
MAEKVKVMQVTVPDTIGAGAKVLSALAEAKVNMVAFCGYTMGKDATMTFIVEPGKEAAAKAAMKAIKCKTTAIDAVVVALANKAGALAIVLEKLAAAKVNLDYAYATTAGRNAAAVLTVSSVAKALKALA